MTRPSVAEEPPWRRVRARSLRSKPSAPIASATRAAVAGATPASALITRETVFRLTPAVCATSLIVGLDNVVNPLGADASRAARLVSSTTSVGSTAPCAVEVTLVGPLGAEARHRVGELAPPPGGEVARGGAPPPPPPRPPP